MLGFDTMIHIVPAATAGVWLSRWAVNQAGEFEDGKPGIKHAIGIYLAATIGAEIVGSVFGRERMGYTTIGALAYGGDLFARKRLFDDSEWVQKNISLQGVDDDANSEYRYSQGRDYEDMGAVSFVDAAGNTYVQTEDGWALAGDGDGDGQQLYQDEDGNIFALNGFMPSSPIGALGSFSQSNVLGAVRPSFESSFGYA